MSGAVAIEQFGLGDSRLSEFARFPWSLYRGDPCWTPPLRADLLGSRLLGTKGLLTAAHPYHLDADVTHFIARQDGRVVGTCSAAVNRRWNEYHDDKVGFFGFFEVVEEYWTAAALLDAAAGWLRERGMTSMRGPGQYSCATHERQGVLVDGFEYPPTVELTHNPRYYVDFAERYGLVKAHDYVAYEAEVADIPLERMRGVADGVRRHRGDISTRPAVLKRFAGEVDLIVRLYNEAWAANWGFLPITPDEARMVADSLAPVVDPGIVRFAYMGDEPVAVLGAIPDVYVALRPRWRWYGDPEWLRLARVLAMRRRIPRVRLMFFGIRPGFRRLGVDAMLFDDIMSYAADKHYTWCEPSMLLEDNEMVLRISAFMGGHEYKRWRIYEKPI